MKKTFLLLSFGIFSALQLVRAADITGTITLKGSPPAELSYASKMQDDPNCVAIYAGNYPTTHFYVVSAAGGLADVVVSLKGMAVKSTGASAAPAVMDQKGALYVPQIVAIQTGQKLIVKNSDTFVHNVHAVPKENPESNQVQMNGGPGFDLHV